MTNEQHNAVIIIGQRTAGMIQELSANGERPELAGAAGMLRQDTETVTAAAIESAEDRINQALRAYVRNVNA